MAKFLLVAFATAAVISITLGAEWSYNVGAPDGPENWKKICKTGRKQSPIDIMAKTTEYDSSLGSFTLTNYTHASPQNFTSFNNKHTLKVSLPSDYYKVSGGNLPGTFTTVQFHLHWGSNNTQGAEHGMDGIFYPAEIHFVSFNEKYPNISESLSHWDGLAVLGVFLKVGDFNSHYDKFLMESMVPKEPGMNKTIPSFPLDPLLPADKAKYFRYDGSLTTPTCNEAVTWTVFNEAVEISQAQMDMLRGLKMDASNKIVNNYRPVLPLNDRTVKSSFVPTEVAADGVALKTSKVILLPILLGVLFKL
ncbi:Carbonic anhydrase 12 [Acropora cervicornis]|uniref:carbonic anhydrase n=1 Tax=Acropora cervicornis TaxID=6130 RepID=A0AAD9VHD5_ACRCE|nr:Carbonic anhydrase 12 [Acropora cervicornis]